MYILKVFKKVFKKRNSKEVYNRCKNIWLKHIENRMKTIH